MDTKRKTLTSKPYTCEYCKKSFTKESTITSHLCEKKRRALQKNERRVQLGYQAFIRFYQLSAGYKGIKTYEEFCNSSFYNAFVKFGSFLSNVKPLYPEKYIDWIVTSNVKLDKWCQDELYEKYVIELIKKENVETALERSIKTMDTWAKEKNSVWNHYFIYASPNRVTWDLKDGKISPWLILNSETGRNMLNNFNDEQLNLLNKILDPKHWSLKFKRHPKDVELVKQIVQEAKL